MKTLKKFLLPFGTILCLSSCMYNKETSQAALLKMEEAGRKLSKIDTTAVKATKILNGIKDSISNVTSLYREIKEELYDKSKKTDTTKPVSVPTKMEEAGRKLAKIDTTAVKATKILDGIKDSISNVTKLYKEIKEELYDKSKKTDTTNKCKQSFRVFANIEAIDNDAPKGLVQTEMYFSWPLNSRYWTRKENISNCIWFRNLVIPAFQINNFKPEEYVLKPFLDKTDSLMPKNEKKKLLNTFDLIQYAHFNNAVKLNILTYMYDKGETKIQVDGVLNHYRTLITNTVAGSNDTSRMAFATIGYGMNFRYSQSVSKSDFSIAVSGAFLAMSLLNNHRNYYQIQGVRYEENRDNLVERRDYQLAEKPWNKVIAILQTEVSYQKKAWLRFQLYTNPFLLPQGAQLRQYCNNYLQVQYGITQEIKDIVRFFSPDTKKTTQE